MEKFIFQIPHIEIFVVSDNDIIITSGGTDGPDGQIGEFPGFDWGTPEE